MLLTYFEFPAIKYFRSDQFIHQIFSSCCQQDGGSAARAAGGGVLLPAPALPADHLQQGLQTLARHHQPPELPQVAQIIPQTQSETFR